MIGGIRYEQKDTNMIGSAIIRYDGIFYLVFQG